MQDCPLALNLYDILESVVKKERARLRPRQRSYGAAFVLQHWGSLLTQ